jgi:hypothetical protein
MKDEPRAATSNDSERSKYQDLEAVWSVKSLVKCLSANEKDWNCDN